MTHDAVQYTVLRQAIVKAQPAGLQKRPNLLMTAGIGLTERDEKKELLYGLMGAVLASR